MSDLEDEFIGHLMTFDKKGQGDEIMNENIFLEVTNATKDGNIELAFTDRNERCYVSFSLPQLLEYVCRKGVTD